MTLPPELAAPTPEASPFHAGELALQERAGTRARLEVAGRRIIRDQMPDQHRELFEKLPYMIAGVADAGGQPWATLLTGDPGFVSTTPKAMTIAALPAPADPAAGTLQVGASVGLLGIELTTRRRNRMNGRVGGVTEAGFTVDVVQSFGNCPKYIQIRQHRRVASERPVVLREETSRLGREALALVEGADTFFIATASGSGPQDWTAGIDVSHRGGQPGFVRVAEVSGRTVLTVADFAGNGFFNTFGNLTQEPRAGLLFVDFEHGHLLQLSVQGTVQWNSPEVAVATGADRVLTLEVTGGHWLLDAVNLRWD
jgi:predicted pyridoxine 5'-phosphate oxidase superfamily flavin-nucleotide-binding protein